MVTGVLGNSSVTMLPGTTVGSCTSSEGGVGPVPAVVVVLVVVSGVTTAAGTAGTTTAAGGSKSWGGVPLGFLVEIERVVIAIFGIVKL